VVDHALVVAVASSHQEEEEVAHSDVVVAGIVHLLPRDCWVDSSIICRPPKLLSRGISVFPAG